MNGDKIHLNFSQEELNNFLRIGGVVCLGLLALFLLAKTVNEVKTYPTIGEDNTSQNIISVNGEADMFVQPDITVFSWTVDASGTSIEEAQTKAAEISNKAIAFLKTKGIKESDIKTTGYYTNTKYVNKFIPCGGSERTKAVSAPTMPSSMQAMAPAPTMAPEQDIMTSSYIAPPCGSQSVPSGYETSQTVEVKVKNVQENPMQTSELIAGLGTIGAKASSPISSVDKPEKYQQKVRAEAIAKARREAENLAESLGVKLVKVVNFSENNYGSPIPYYGRDSMSATMANEKAVVAPELPTGTNKISSMVTVSYQIR